MAEDVKRQKKWRATIYDVDPLTGYCSRMHYVEAEKLEELEEMVACEDDSSLIQIQFIPIEDGLHIDTENGSQVFSGTTLSLMMQMARDSFIKPRETADGFIPGAFIA